MTAPEQDAVRKIALETLRVRRGPSKKRQTAADARALAERWAVLCPPGTQIRYYPVWGRWERFELDVIAHSASVLPSVEAVLWLEGRSGCVSAAHCEPAELAQAALTAAPKRPTRSQQRYQRWLDGPAEFLSFREFLASDAATKGGHHVR